MEHAAPEGIGAMSAVLGLDATVIEDVLNGREGVSIANYNCPGQIVITGEAKAVAEAGTALKEAGAFTDDETSGRGTGEGFCRSQHESSESSVCGEHQRRGNYRLRKDRRTSGGAGQRICPLAAECGNHDP